VLKPFQINIFVRVVKRKVETEGRTAADILDNDYPALTDTDKNNILSKI